MAATEPQNGDSNVDFIAWDTLQTLLSAPLSSEAYEPLPGASNFEWIMWEILQNIGGGGGGGLPAGTNGDVLVYDGAWTGSSIIVDSSLNFAIDISKRTFIDEFGTDSVNGADRLLVTASGSEVIRWDLAQLFDTSEVKSLDWDKRTLLDDGEIISFDWVQRQLNDSSETLVMDYQNRLLYDDLGSDSIRFGSRILMDSVGLFSANYGDRKLLNDTTEEFVWAASGYNGSLIPKGRRLSVGVELSTNAQRALNVEGYMNLIQPFNAPSGAADAGSIEVYINNTKYLINVKPS